MYKRWGKRSLDIILAGIGLIVLFPLLLLIALALLLTGVTKPLFYQARPGLDAQLFTIVKFRTMKGSSTEEPFKDSERITRLGRLLRLLSLDELPQLWNVVKGDMSLVGPRPLLPKYLPLYSPQQNQRHLVRPGITGWAQVNGRNAIGWDQKLELDQWYVQHYSFLIDSKIILLTLTKWLPFYSEHQKETAIPNPFHKNRNPE